MIKNIPRIIFSILLVWAMALVSVMSLYPDEAYAAEKVGVIGEVYHWSISNDGVLTIFRGKRTGYPFISSSASLGYSSYRDEIEEVRISSQNDGVLSVCGGLFSGMKNLKRISGLENLTFRRFVHYEVDPGYPSLHSLFSGCSSLEEIDMSQVSVSGITSIANAFRDCSSLRSLIVPFGTGNVASYKYAFTGCTSLKSLDISTFNTKKLSSSEIDAHKGIMFDDALEQITIGKDFTMQRCLPDGIWYNSAGQGFTPANILLGVAGTYTKGKPATSVSISGLQSQYLSIGDEVQLTADVQPSPTSDSISWVSSDDSVASIDATGKVTAHGKGTAVIIVTVGSAKASVTITVEEPVSSLSMKETSKTSYVDDGAFTLGVNTSPAGLHPQLTWKSSNESVATVDSAGNVTPHKAGSATITASTSDGKTASCALTVKAGSSKPSKPTEPEAPDSSNKPTTPSNPSSGNSNTSKGKTHVMFRLYNPNSGEHFYAASVSERDSLVRVGWNNEGKGWTAPASSKTPVFRLYSGTDHRYTPSAAERDAPVRAGWKYEGIGWYSDDAKGMPLYRQFNPNVNPAAPTNNSGSHNYTLSRPEHDFLCANGWTGEGIGWYGCK